MRLRNRIVLALITIALVLVAPSLYGLLALTELQSIARSLRTRDAVGSLALGRLQAALGQVENAGRVNLALGGGNAAEREPLREQIANTSNQVEAQLGLLADAGYDAVAAPAPELWQSLRAAIAEEQRLVEAGELVAAEQQRNQVVTPGFAALDTALDPIGIAINRAGQRALNRAQDVAVRAETTILLALAIALAIAIAIASLLTRSLVRPIHQLQRGMAVVAGGGFDPEIGAPLERPDELGDLSRSFQQMTGHLAELDRMKAEFVSVASHELKTPLSVIKGFVSLLHDGIYGEVPEEQRKILRSVGDQTDRLARLIQQLLDVSRLEAGGVRLDLSPFGLHGFLNELTTSFDVLAYQSDMDFALIEDAQLPETLVGDADRLNEVIGNLLSNAFKFTPRGGTIRLKAAARDGEVVIEVSDSGVGIPADQLPRIFEKFYQVENEAQPRSVGSGLGLAIAKEIVEAHGGTIAAESTLGTGTIFRVALPETAPLAAATPPNKTG
jgi:signal transduction histidine kinase